MPEGFDERAGRHPHPRARRTAAPCPPGREPRGADYPGRTANHGLPGLPGPAARGGGRRPRPSCPTPAASATTSPTCCIVTAMLNSPAGCALQCLMSETERDESFARLLHERVKEPRKRMFLDLLMRGAARGQVRPAAATQLVAEVGPALVMQRFLSDGAPVPDDYVVSVVDDVVMPLLRPVTQGTPA